MQPPRRFTTHPDEIEEGTVRHNPTSRQKGPVATGQKDYLDLFSPVKPLADKDTHKSPVRRLNSPPGPRSRVSPQTFLKSPEPKPAGQYGSISKPRNLALFPSTDSSSGTARPLPTNSSRNTGHDVQDLRSPLWQGRKITFKPTSQRQQRGASPYRITKSSPNQNAKVLADLRRLRVVGPTNQSNGTLSAFGPSNTGSTRNKGSPSAKQNALRLFRRSENHIETDMNSEHALKVYEHVHHKVNWPEDSNQDPSLGEDIWLTSDSDDMTTRRQGRKRHAVERPPARQTSRSRVGSKCTMSTNGQTPIGLDVGPKSIKAALDGSTEDDRETAHSPMSPSGPFSPSSGDVRDLFPRTSSLTPKKDSKSRNRLQNAQAPLHQPLREVALNSVVARQSKGPWARVKTGKNKLGGQTSELAQADTRNVNILEEHHYCNTCISTRSRAHELEGEVARLKGELIAAKAVLRRNGIPMPLSMR